MRRHAHSLSHFKNISMNMGPIVPIGLVEVLPGDTIQQATTALVRCAPTLAPVMHPVHAKIHHWFVPHRLVWDGFEDFITGGPDGTNTDQVPRLVLGPTFTQPGTLADYLGIPEINSGQTKLVNALPFRGYQLIYNEFYRDQDLISEVDFGLGSGDLPSGGERDRLARLRQSSWEKDYFTSARPFEQKGPSVQIPLLGQAPVEGIGTGTAVNYSTGNLRVTGGNVVNDSRSDTSPGNPVSVREDPDNPGFPLVNADLSQATGVSITQLREALGLQRFMEASARYGSRYSEYLLRHGVVSPDARLQRPEYLGGGRQTIQWSEVLQTAEGTSPVGQLRGHGIGGIRSNRYRRYFSEHGYIISMMIVRPKTMYQSMVHKHWYYRDKEDFWQNELQHIGQQTVTNGEADINHVNADGVFGYQNRYQQYRNIQSGIGGEFRDVLNFWHFARDIGTNAALNSDFVQAGVTDRPFAVTGQDTLYVMAQHSIQARRLVSKSTDSHVR